MNSEILSRVFRPSTQCKMQINKEGKVRRSKWDVQPLSDAQQIYAAIDVYVSIFRLAIANVIDIQTLNEIIVLCFNTIIVNI